MADPDGWLDGARDQILSYLHEHGPTTARELGRQVPALRQPLVMAAGTAWEAKISAHTRVITLLGFQGEILRGQPTGSWVNGAYRYAAADRWLPGGLGQLDERTAAADLARLWLPAFGPATTVDLSWWMGWTKAMTRQALADAGAVEVELDDGPGWIAADDPGPPDGRAVGGRAARARSHHHGLEAAGLVSAGGGRGGLRPRRERRSDDLGRRSDRRRLGADPGGGDPDALLRAGRG